MANNPKPARILLGFAILLICVGLAMFLMKPLVALPLVIVGVALVVVSSSQWARRPGKTPHHYASHKKPHH